MPVSSPLTAAEVLNREFLEVRARLLEVAAALDRIDRGKGSRMADSRLENIRRALAVLADDQGGRAERLQMIFSQPYSDHWRSELGLDASK